MLLGNLLVGIAMLLFGRRIFWVFVAGLGFVVGALLAVEFLREQPGWVVLAVALGAGIVGALIALFAQKLAVAVAGLLAGGYLGHTITLALNANFPAWVGFVAGAVIGCILLVMLFDWALIALSSLVGSAVIAQSVPLAPPWPILLFVVLLCIGLALQGRQLKGRPLQPKEA